MINKKIDFKILANRNLFYLSYELTKLHFEKRLLFQKTIFQTIIMDNVFNVLAAVTIIF